jgi:hypothetical protein
MNAAPGYLLRPPPTATSKDKEESKNRYLYVGMLNIKTGKPKEGRIDLEKIGSDNKLLYAILEKKRELRPWWREAFSLKSIQAFSIYERTSTGEIYFSVKLQGTNALHLGRFFRACHSLEKAKKAEEGTPSPGKSDTDSWKNWLQDFAEHDYRLQLVLRWSILKIAIYGMTPVLLSLAVLGWYQSTPGADSNIVKQTALAIATYIITATARKLPAISDVSALLMCA